MIIQSKDMSQAEFIRAVLERDFRNIHKAQLLIVSEGIWREGRELKAKERGIRIRKRTGRLEDVLANPDFIMQSNGEIFTVADTYPLYIRFLDMKHLKDLRIYNRQIWGILFNNALKDIKFKYGKVIADRVGDALYESFSTVLDSSPDDRSSGNRFNGKAYHQKKGR